MSLDNRPKSHPRIVTVMTRWMISGCKLGWQVGSAAVGALSFAPHAQCFTRAMNVLLQNGMNVLLQNVQDLGGLVFGARGGCKPFGFRI